MMRWAIQSLVCKNKDLKVYPLLHWQPVEVLEYSRHVSYSQSKGYNSGTYIFQPLEMFQSVTCDSSQEHISVVYPWDSQGMDQQIVSNPTYIAQMHVDVTAHDTSWITAGHNAPQDLSHILFVLLVYSRVDLAEPSDIGMVLTDIDKQRP